MTRPRWAVSVWPRSLATQTAVVLLGGLAIIQVAGLAIYASDRLDLQRLAQSQEIGLRVAGAYRSVVQAAPEQREMALQEVDALPGLTATLDATALPSALQPAAPPMQRALRISMQSVPMPGAQRWKELVILGGPGQQRMMLSLRMPSGEWLNVQLRVRRFLPFWSQTFLLTFMVMTAAASLLVVWAVRQFSAPMRALAAAAEQLGLDVNAPPMPETGSIEARQAAIAFNTMAARIRRFVQDRMFLLTAIGHDLRTPITRLKLRAEWMEDEEQRDKMLADLDELEAMVAATLAFGRDDAASEAPAALDLAELLRTILDEAGDAKPALAERVSYDGPAHQVIRVRPVAIKRAFSNLVLNALNYGGGVRVTLIPPSGSVLTVLLEDDGPGIPAAELDRVFEPFHRVENSRNRETGGTGLGLPIARNILRAHGGDVVLSNRVMGGIRAFVTLPV